LIQLPQDRNRAKFAVSDEKNSRFWRQQPFDLAQQVYLSFGTTVTANLLEPSPGDRHGPMTIGQREHEQLVTESNFGAVHDQADLANSFELRLQPGFRNRFVPAADIDSWVRQKSAQASDRTFILGCTDYFSSNLAQMHGVTMKDTNQQPHKVLNLGYALLRSQFTNSLNPSTIGLVDRHSILLAKVFVVKQLYLIFGADQYSFVKVSGD
jgi:hypothetical protein